MALDGYFLSKLKDELLSRAVGTKIDKVQQPSKDEILLTLRHRSGSEKLLICVRADAPRVHFTAQNAQNPTQPPMFCMLLRKYLTGAKITNVRQIGLDRLLFFDLDATTEIGDKTTLQLCVETMGTYSNLILIAADGKIIDAAKRIDFAASSVRQILPGLPYVLPQQQGKLNLETETADAVAGAILAKGGKLLSSAALQTVQGISPHRVGRNRCGADRRPKGQSAGGFAADEAGAAPRSGVLYGARRRRRAERDRVDAYLSVRRRVPGQGL